MGRLDGKDAWLRRLSNVAGIIIMSVDYRCACLHPLSCIAQPHGWQHGLLSGDHLHRFRCCDKEDSVVGTQSLPTGCPCRSACKPHGRQKGIACTRKTPSDLHAMGMPDASARLAFLSVLHSCRFIMFALPKRHICGHRQIIPTLLLCCLSRKLRH